jgi:ubiquitin-protein ligase E3 A
MLYCDLGFQGKIKTALLTFSYDRESFLRILNIFQQFINNHYQPNSSHAYDSVIAAVKFLSLIYHANESATPQPLLEISYFYNDCICRKLNFKEEYKIWKRKAPSISGSSAASSIPRSSSRTFSNGSPGFSFFNFPFILDPVAKTRVMHIDAMTQMSLEFEDAFVHQALVIHAQRFLHDSESVNTFEKGMETKTNPYLVLEVRRLRLVDDVLEQVAKKQADLKKPLKGMHINLKLQSNS